MPRRERLALWTEDLPHPPTKCRTQGISPLQSQPGARPASATRSATRWRPAERSGVRKRWRGGQSAVSPKGWARDFALSQALPPSKRENSSIRGGGTLPREQEKGCLPEFPSLPPSSQTVAAQQPAAEYR